MSTKKDKERSTGEALRTKRALKLALEALEECRRDPRLKYEHPYYDKTIIALREALAAVAEAHKQSAEIPQSITCPFCESQHVPGWLHDYNMDRMKKPAQQEPASKPWVGLTDEAVWSLYKNLWMFHPAEEPRLAGDILKFARAIETKLKEKNGF